MLSALVLGFPDPLSMGLASGWLMAGRQIKGIWFPRRAISSSQFERDRGWARTAPGISMHGICERAGLRPRAVPPLAVWHEAVDEMKALAPDVVLSLMFTDRIPRLVLTAFPGRVLNLHPSMLPAYRGANPIFNMLWDRSIDRYSGVSLHLVDENFDSGSLLAQSAVPFPQTRRLGSYFMELVKAGSPLLVGAVADYLAGRLQAVEQQRGVWPQSIHKPGHAKLSRNMTAMEVEWLSSTIPQMAPLRIEGQPEALLVAGFEQILGPPTGAPISTDRDHIEIDFVDRRIRLRRLNS